jgi:hypothetical protein
MKPATFQIGNQNNTNEKEERSNRENEKEEYKNIYSIKPLKVAENVYYLQK